MNTFEFIGIISTICFAVAILTVLAVVAKEKIEDMILKHKIKHRFDKKPIAKCYCTDCKYFTNAGKCEISTMYTGDNHFCKNATPKTNE